MLCGCDLSSPRLWQEEHFRPEARSYNARRKRIERLSAILESCFMTSYYLVSEF